jgi:hypothetical protein
VPVLDQLTVNEYTPGVGIAPHVEAHTSFTGSIMSLSLLGGCVMVFRKAYIARNPCNYNISSSSDGGVCCGSSSTSSSSSQSGDGPDQGQQGDRQVLVYLPPRSLVVMTGEARYAWCASCWCCCYGALRMHACMHACMNAVCPAASEYEALSLINMSQQGTQPVVVPVVVGHLGLDIQSCQAHLTP